MLHNKKINDIYTNAIYVCKVKTYDKCFLISYTNCREMALVLPNSKLQYKTGINNKLNLKWKNY